MEHLYGASGISLLSPVQRRGLVPAQVLTTVACTSTPTLGLLQRKQVTQLTLGKSVK